MNKITFDGLDELNATLATLPQDLRNEAALLVLQSAKEAAARIFAAYPVHTGNLRHGVAVTYGKGGQSIYRVAAAVINRAPHAYIFEWGTTTRQVKTLPEWPLGNRGLSRGRMPPGKVFYPIYWRYRRALDTALARLVERHGLKVA